MICNKCNEEKNDDDFSFKNKKKGIRQKTCKLCLKEYRKNYYSLNKENAIEYAKTSSKQIKQRNQQYIWDFLTVNPCVDCGESNPVVLEFDHKDDSTKTLDVCQAAQYGWSLERIKKEIDKCVVRCANCHRKRTALQFHWYKNIQRNAEVV